MARSMVLVVDDDTAIRDSLSALLESAGHAVKAYPSARTLLNDRILVGSCLLADVRMPEMDGLELQEEIGRRGIELPVIIMTGHGDVPLAVRAMKAGAVDFIEKPFGDEHLLDCIDRALRIGEQKQGKTAEFRAAQELIALLTPRERHVLDQLVAGRSNKIAAYELGISPRTIEIHRAHIMDKMNARSLSDLVRIAIAASPAAKG
jgi:two-component system, LuxR family, response regulator FixJ